MTAWLLVMVSLISLKGYVNKLKDYRIKHLDNNTKIYISLCSLHMKFFGLYAKKLTYRILPTDSTMKSQSSQEKDNYYLNV